MVRNPQRIKNRSSMDTSRRGSTFLENDLNSSYLYPSRNESMDCIDASQNYRSKIPVRFTRKDSERTKKALKSRTLKRSSMALDGSMVRDYNLAVQGLNMSSNTSEKNSKNNDKPQPHKTVRSDSELTLTSNDSITSSIFSNDGDVSLIDLLYEELSTIADTKDKLENNLHCSKALFMIKDNYKENGIWLDVNQGNSPKDKNADHLSDTIKDYARTTLEFI